MNILEKMEICDVLHRLGLTANHAGFFYITSAVSLAAENPNRLLLVTKWLYPDVAKYYKTTWTAVERGIRYELSQLWLSDSMRFKNVLQYPCNHRPTPAEFISYLVTYCYKNKTA